MKTDCPGEEMMADYIDGRLSEKHRTDIETHLLECDHCLEGFISVHSLLSEDMAAVDPVPDRVTASAIAIVTDQYAKQFLSVWQTAALWAKDLLSKLSDMTAAAVFGEPQLAPIRGSQEVLTEGLVSLKKTFKGFDTEIEIEQTADDSALIRVMLVDSDIMDESLRVTLLNSSDREVSSYLMDEGYALFEGVPFGKYHLDFSRNGTMIGTYHFEIKVTIHER